MSEDDVQQRRPDDEGDSGRHPEGSVGLRDGLVIRPRQEVGRREAQGGALPDVEGGVGSDQAAIALLHLTGSSLTERAGAAVASSKRRRRCGSGGNVSGAQVSLTAAAGAAGGIAVDAADAEAADRRPPGRQAEGAGVAGIREAVGASLPGPGPPVAIAAGAGATSIVGGTTRPASPLRLLRLLVDIHVANTNVGRTKLSRRHVTGPDFTIKHF